MLAQRLRAPAIQTLDLHLGQRRVIPHAAGLIPHRLRDLSLVPDFALLAQRVAPLDVQFAKPILHGLELTPQLLQGVGCGFQPRALLGECGNLAGRAHPVDVRKARELFQLAECIQPAPQFLARLLDLADALPQRGQPCLQMLPLVTQSAQLVGIAPAEHVAAAIVDAAAVVLLVAPARVLDLTGARDGARLAAELLAGVAAGDVEALAKLLFQPLVVRRIRLDDELAHQRLRMQSRALGSLSPTHMEVHQPGAQMLAVHPVRNGLVVRVRNQQREAEATQQPLGGAFPIALVVTHLDELARERQFVLTDSQGRTQRIADADLGGVDVALAPLETFDLVGQGGVLFTALAESEVLLALAVVQVGNAFAQAIGTLGNALLLGEEACFIGRRRLVDAGQQFLEAVGLLLALILVLLQTANLRRQLLQAVAAVVAQGPLQTGDFNALGLTLRVQALDLAIEPSGIIRQQVEAAIQQLALEPGEIRPKLIARIPPTLNLGDQLLVAPAVLDQRRQQVDLPLGLEHGLMRPVQVIKVADQRLDAAAHIEGFQHVAAYEVGEVAHRLHRDSLVEQLQCLLVLDAEAPAEPGPIRREAVEQLAAGAAQLLAQGGDVAAEDR